jgi:hypothetical protein
MKLLQQVFSAPASDLDSSSFKSLLIRKRWTELLQQVKDDPAFVSSHQNGGVAGRQLRSNDAREAPAADNEEEPAARQQVQEQTPAQMAAAKRKHKQMVSSLSKQRKEKNRLMESLQQRLEKLNKEKHQLVTQLKQVNVRLCHSSYARVCMYGRSQHGRSQHRLPPRVLKHSGRLRSQ